MLAGTTFDPQLQDAYRLLITKVNMPNLTLIVLICNIRSLGEGGYLVSSK